MTNSRLRIDINSFRLSLLACLRRECCYLIIPTEVCRAMCNKLISNRKCLKADRTSLHLQKETVAGFELSAPDTYRLSFSSHEGIKATWKIPAIINSNKLSNGQLPNLVKLRL